MPYLNDDSIDLTDIEDLNKRRTLILEYMKNSNFLSTKSKWYHFDLFKLRQKYDVWGAKYSVDQFSIPAKVFSANEIEETNSDKNENSFHWFAMYKRHMSQYMLVVRNEGTLDESFELTIDEKDRRIVISWFNVNKANDLRTVTMYNVGTGNYPIIFKGNDIEFTYLYCLLNYLIFGHYIEVNG
ncbi:hypothetical protein phiOC_p247 [Ochrobactrum phage vB_OspM_OC]|nr:hypothetical protein phiOC_p247 [Ochrobactrum phage vB_OspM_OC]